MILYNKKDIQIKYMSINNSSDHSRLGTPLPTRVALLRALPGLGDFLCSVPAFRALRAALPQARLTLVGLPGVRPLVERFGQYIDELLVLPGYPGLVEQPPNVPELPDFLRQAHERRFDLAIQLHGSGQLTNPLTVLLGASQNAGFYLPGMYCPDPTRFLLFDQHESEIRWQLRLLEFLGVPSQGEELEFPVTREDRQALAAIEQVRQLSPGQYVCIHPGAQDPARRWEPSYFAQVADRLARQGLRVVLTGNRAEWQVAEAVGQAMSSPYLNLAGGTGLGALAALLEEARLVVCNDTGVSHLAAALDVPSTVIFMASDPARWGPLNRERHRVVVQNSQTPAETLKAVLYHATDLVEGKSNVARV